MRIALTGASGKVGAAFAQEALRAGHSLLCLGRDLPNALEGKADFHCLDLAAPTIDPRIVAALKGADTVVHLAARIDTNPADDDAALALFRINVLGTRRLIEGLAQAGVEHIVVASAANIYDPRLALADEGSPFRPVSRTLYLSSKVAQESIALETCRQNGIRCAIMRVSSVVGTMGDDLITMLMAKVARGEAVTVTNPTYGADFISLDSVVHGFMIAVMRRLEGEFNLSSGSRHNLQEIVALIGARLGREPVLDLRDAPGLPDHGFPAIDCNRLQAEGYRPEGLDDLITRLAKRLVRDPAALAMDS